MRKEGVSHKNKFFTEMWDKNYKNWENMEGKAGRGQRRFYGRVDFVNWTSKDEEQRKQFKKENERIMEIEVGTPSAFKRHL